MDRRAAKAALTPERIYLDHAATTPCRQEVVDAMIAVLQGAHNAGSTHAEGRRARALVDGARERVATLLGARQREIVFTAGGTEANNLAIAGVARAQQQRGRHLVTVATEHHAVLRAMHALREDGWQITVLTVDSAGRVDPAAFAAALRRGTVLASVMLANNETGTIAPVAELAAIARERGVLFHTDAVAAAGKIPLDVERLGVDLLSISAHKFYGPQGAGALYVRSGTPLAPMLHGGAQERGLRSGTETVAAIAGLGMALELSAAEMPVAGARIGWLRDRLEAGILGALPGAVVHGAAAPRLPTIANVGLPGADRVALLVRLDLEGIAASAGSACSSGAAEPSHVISALGDDLARAAVVRFSLGRDTTPGEIDAVLARLPAIAGATREFPEFLGTT